MTKNSPDYKEILQQYKLSANSRKGKSYQYYEKHYLSDYQSFLYNRVMYGLSVYSQEEINTMNPKKRKRIIKVHKRALKILNELKQKIIIKITNEWFERCFGKSEFARQLIENYSDICDPEFKVKVSFDDLKINQKMIIDLFISEGILPNNFNELKSEANGS